MGLFNLFSEKKEFTPTNEIEQMLARAEYNADPRRFYEHLISRQLFVVVQDNGKDNREVELRAGDTVAFVVTAPIEGVGYTYAFTSLEALQFMAIKNKSDCRYLRLEGGTLLQMLIDANLGFNLNPGLVTEPVVASPSNLKFVLNELAKPTPNRVEVLDIAAGSTIRIGMPAVWPDQQLKAVSNFLRNTGYKKALFALMQIEEGVPQYWIGLHSGANPESANDAIIKLGNLLNDINDPKPQFKFIFRALSDERYEKYAGQAREITAEGWVK